MSHRDGDGGGDGGHDQPASHPKKTISSLFERLGGQDAAETRGLEAHGRSNSSRVCGLLRVCPSRFSCKKRDERHTVGGQLFRPLSTIRRAYTARNTFVKPVLAIGSANRMRHRIRVPTRLHLRLVFFFFLFVLPAPRARSSLLPRRRGVCLFSSVRTSPTPIRLLSCSSRRRLHLEAATSATRPRQRDVRMWAGPDLTYAIF